MGKKHLLLAFCAFTCCAYSYAESPKSMQVWLKDGQQKSFYVSDVDSVTFGIAEEQPYQELNEWTMPPAIKNAAPLSLSDNEMEYVKKGNEFALRFFNEICQNDTTQNNKFFSPISLQIALAMCANGASEKGALEIANNLGFSQGDELSEMNKYYNKVYLSMNSEIDGSVFSIANAIWPVKGSTVLEPFLSTVREQYYATVRHLDYEHQSKAAGDTICKWAEMATNGKIKDLSLRPNDLTRLIINNACYFKADWQTEFDSALTKTDTFTNIFGKKEQVEMMEQIVYTYQKREWGKEVTLPYHGPYSILLILPDDGVSVEKAIASINTEDLIHPNYSDLNALLQLPKFKIKDAIDLKDVTAKLGMTDIFDQFPNAIDEEISISRMMQDTYIKLDEHGTEAAAVTSIAADNAVSINTPDLTVKFDKPFGFAIVERNTGMILFLGKYTQVPQEEN